MWNQGWQWPQLFGGWKSPPTATRLACSHCFSDYPSCLHFSLTHAGCMGNTRALSGTLSPYFKYQSWFFSTMLDTWAIFWCRWGHRRKAAERKEENWHLVRVETSLPNPLVFCLISTAMREKIDFTPSIIPFPPHQYIVSLSLHIFLPQLSYSRSDTCINICWQWSLFWYKKRSFQKWICNNLARVQS